MSASAAYFWIAQGSRIRPPRPLAWSQYRVEGMVGKTEKGITWCVCKRVYIAITILSRTPITAAAEDLPAIQASAELLLRETILRAIIVCREGLLDKEGFLGTLSPRTSGYQPYCPARRSGKRHLPKKRCPPRSLEVCHTHRPTQRFRLC